MCNNKLACSLWSSFKNKLFFYNMPPLPDELSSFFLMHDVRLFIALSKWTSSHHMFSAYFIMNDKICLCE